MHLFRNDYSEGAAPQIMDAIAACGGEQSVGYTEGDAHCEHARELIRKACGCPDAMVEFCIGGTSANVICLSGRFTAPMDNCEFVKTFLTTEFGGGRHTQRVAKIMAEDERK